MIYPYLHKLLLFYLLITTYFYINPLIFPQFIDLFFINTKLFLYQFAHTEYIDNINFIFFI